MVAVVLEYWRLQEVTQLLVSGVMAALLTIAQAIATRRELLSEGKKNRNRDTATPRSRTNHEIIYEAVFQDLKIITAAIVAVVTTAVVEATAVGVTTAVLMATVVVAAAAVDIGEIQMMTDQMTMKVAMIVGDSRTTRKTTINKAGTLLPGTFQETITPTSNP